ncbi:MAG: glycoside hydrolase family 3 C-terminal domain-containing protein [Dehalococcoidales bacterium]|nr:glycoside hydrolase family 3 C-terminal domain-containing protein [Dehalococcoidales bacterium]
MEKRIASLLKEMTLEEKISLVSGKDFWHTQNIDRLGIPSMKLTDGPHGCKTASDLNSHETLHATCFPTGVGLAATWNTELVEKVGAAIGRETRERGCSVILGPCVNIHRIPLGGRNFESYSEDPYLSSRMTVAFIRGVQSQGTAACVKHFALNNQEHRRMTMSSEAWERTMREIYFPSFEKAVKEAGVLAVMCSYNRINGIYSSENRWLLTDVLKKEWGFEGAVISDWFATHSTIPAAISGLDLEMPGPALWFGKKLFEAVKRGDVPEEAVNEMVRRILFVMVKTGTIDGSLKLGNLKSNPAHERLAFEAAGESIVLLKNERNILPLKKSIRSIAVIGPLATRAAVQGGGSAQVEPYYTVSPLEALKKKLGDKVTITYEPGCLSNVYTSLLTADYLTPSTDAKENGLLGEYFDNNSFSGKPVAKKIDKKFKAQWILAPPVPEIKGNIYSIRWTGFFNPPETGKYKFGMATIGWARLYIGEKLVCTNWGEKISTEVFMVEEKTAEIRLRSGKSYPIKIEYITAPSVPSPVRSIRIGVDLPVPPDLQKRAVKAAGSADIAIIFAGLTDEYESEGFDRKNMDLPEEQAQLIQKVAEVNPNTIVVLNNGSPVTMKPWIDNVPAVLEAFFPGQESGNAIACILLGEINPSGKLPDTFPARYEDNPASINYPGEADRVLYGEGIYVGYRYYEAKKIEPLFPFGHGLSYTTFKYSNLQVSPLKVKKNEKINISIEITNTGRRYGKEVVQLYVSDLASKVARPPRELKAFTKIGLEPGETKIVSFILDEQTLSFWDTETGGWVAEPGVFEILVGSSSRDIRAKKKFELVD